MSDHDVPLSTYSYYGRVTLFPTVPHRSYHRTTEPLVSKPKDENSIRAHFDDLPPGWSNNDRQFATLPLPFQGWLETIVRSAEVQRFNAVQFFSFFFCNASVEHFSTRLIFIIYFTIRNILFWYNEINIYFILNFIVFYNIILYFRNYLIVTFNFTRLFNFEA